MKINKKGMEGYGTLLSWIIIIGIGILLLIIMGVFTDIGKSAWNSIKEAIGFF
ncbi:hypothetical protein HYX06_05815 [Candidatus Woesearchaeota archaeon]|nr:hypothetical protein [Candidatus Woesearchaeota archaeon]